MRRVGEDNPESSRIMLGLLDAVEQNRAQSQRLLASELGIALGLVNAYLKRCIKKGLVKFAARQPRYAYYLTPRGFAEKSRLTVDYLSFSFGFFRQAKTDCSELFKAASARRPEHSARGPDGSRGDRLALRHRARHPDCGCRAAGRAEGGIYRLARTSTISKRFSLHSTPC